MGWGHNQTDKTNKSVCQYHTSPCVYNASVYNDHSNLIDYSSEVYSASQKKKVSTFKKSPYIHFKILSGKLHTCV